MHRTYLDACLKEGKTVRWPDSAMPIKVYIAPFRWYEKSKQQVSYMYNQMVIESLNRWQEATNGAVKFQLVGTVNQSQIDINWRRVDRKSLGHCKYLINDRSMLYSAEIEIGISDGILHASYDDMDEVRHTIIHEIGHALGLVDHSDHGADIMYVPHQYGVVDISKRDILTLNTLYKLPVGFDYIAIGKKYNLKEPFDFHQVLDQVEGKSGSGKVKRDTFFEKAKPQQRREQPERLAHHHDILSTRGKMFLQTQNILSPQDKEQLALKKLRVEEIKNRARENYESPDAEEISEAEYD